MFSPEQKKRILEQYRPDLHRLLIPRGYHSISVVEGGEEGIAPLLDEVDQHSGNIRVDRRSLSTKDKAKCVHAELLIARALFFRNGKNPYAVDVPTLLSTPESKFDSACDTLLCKAKNKTLILYRVFNLDSITKLSKSVDRQGEVSSTLYKLLTIHDSTAVFIGPQDRSSLYTFWNGYFVNELYDEAYTYTPERE